MATKVKVYRVASPSVRGLTTALEEYLNEQLAKLPADAQIQTSTTGFTSAGTAPDGRDEHHLVVTFTITASNLDGI